MLPMASHVEYAPRALLRYLREKDGTDRQTDGQTDGRTPDRCITLIVVSIVVFDHSAVGVTRHL